MHLLMFLQLQQLQPIQQPPYTHSQRRRRFAEQRHKQMQVESLSLSARRYVFRPDLAKSNQKWPNTWPVAVIFFFLGDCYMLICRPTRGHQAVVNSACQHGPLVVAVMLSRCQRGLGVIVSMLSAYPVRGLGTAQEEPVTPI